MEGREVDSMRGGGGGRWMYLKWSWYVRSMPTSSDTCLRLGTWVFLPGLGNGITMYNTWHSTWLYSLRLSSSDVFGIVRSRRFARRLVCSIDLVLWSHPSTPASQLDWKGTYWDPTSCRLLPTTLSSAPSWSAGWPPSLTGIPMRLVTGSLVWGMILLFSRFNWSEAWKRKDEDGGFLSVNGRYLLSKSRSPVVISSSQTPLLPST